MLSEEYGATTVEEYLRLEAQSQTRHEYVSGEIFAMASCTLRHNVIAGNVAVTLRVHLRNTPCRPFIGDVKVRLSNPNAYYYPDVFVSCQRDGESMDLEASAVDDAVLIVEVLSPGTEAIDRREKLVAYRTLPSLAEYMLISQDQARVEIHRRRGDIGWEKIEYSDDEIIELASVNLSISMRDIYQGVPIEPLMRGPGQN